MSTGCDSSDWILIQSEDDGYDFSDWILILEENDDEKYGSYSDQEEEYDYDQILFLGNAAYGREKEKERSVLMELIKHQVLPRLPAKSLLRFKSTSREWNSYISSPLFVHTHSLLSRSLTGLFFHTPTRSPSFAPFDPNPLPDPTLSFLPEPVIVKSSTNGLLCCLGRKTTTYYITNPTTAQWTILPPPTNDHGADPTVVIVFQEPSVFNFSADYHVVCSYELFEGVYAFETISSANCKWRRSGEIAYAERIVCGVSVGGCAYWRTTMQTVLAYDPETDVLREVARGVGYDEIGELGGRLCCVGASGVRVLEGGSEGKWREVMEFAEEGIVPLRTQGEREVLVWERESRTVVAYDVVDGGKRMVVDFTAPGYCADFLPYVSSLVHVRGCFSG